MPQKATISDEKSMICQEFVKKFTAQISLVISFFEETEEGLACCVYFSMLILVMYYSYTCFTT